MHSPTSTSAVRQMFDRIAPTYDVLNTVLSLGVHRIWERKAVALLPSSPEGSCLDLCTGTGALVPALASKFAKVVAADISPEMLGIARKRWESLKNCEWREADAQALPFSEGQFNAVSVSYGVRNLPDPALGLREMCRVTAPGGWLVVLEFGQPSNAVWRKIFSLYSRFVIPLIGRVVSGSTEAYRYLPETSAAFPCGERFEELLLSAGWKPERTLPLLGGIAFLYLAQRSG
jgi:demethylmenaquinone methyltransferase/2-methoxy-6-polyprenyl-1,4-benzoquinol methylase